MTATQPSSVQAQLMPIPLNMYVAKSGNPAPNSDRRKVLAAMADAANYKDLCQHCAMCANGQRQQGKESIEDVKRGFALTMRYASTK